MRASHSFGCKATVYQVCLACGSKVCACHGTARGQCPVCYVGMLSQFYPIKGRPCGYKGCARPAVVAVPRVKGACLEHARERAGYDPARKTAGHEPDVIAGAMPAPYTGTLHHYRPELFPAGTMPAKVTQ